MVAKLVQSMGVNIGHDLPVNLEDSRFNFDFLPFENSEQKIESISHSIRLINKTCNVWGWKYPKSVIYLESIWSELVNPHLLCIFRDPLLISYRNIVKRSTEPYKTIRNAVNLQQKNINFLQKHQEVPQFLCSYEKVLQDPSLFVQSLAKFLCFEFTNKSEVENFSKLVNPLDGYKSNKFHASK